MSAEFVVGASSSEQFPTDGVPEIAFVGRSNVGKSSLLNALLLRRRGSRSGPPERRKLARTSRTPGRTQGVHFFRIDGAFYFVDLPGYGYAKAPRRALAGWRKLAESYLRDRPALRLVVLIIDIRHGASPLDGQMRDWLVAFQQGFIVVASKADKLKRSERQRALLAIAESFHSALSFSAKTGEGVAALWTEIRKALETPASP